MSTIRTGVGVGKLLSQSVVSRFSLNKSREKVEKSQMFLCIQRKDENYGGLGVGPILPIQTCSVQVISMVFDETSLGHVGA